MPTQFLTKYQDRVVYGADFRLRDGDDNEAWRSVNAQHERDWAFLSEKAALTYGKNEVKGLGLPETVLRKIFYENPQRWFPGIV
jgi:hypothetical protein